MKSIIDDQKFRNGVFYVSCAQTGFLLGALILSTGFHLTAVVICALISVLSGFGSYLASKGVSK